MKIAFELDMSGRIGVKQSGGRCRCSKIMSPLTATRLCHPLRDGDDESERAATSEGDGKCGRGGGRGNRKRPPAPFWGAGGGEETETGGGGGGGAGDGTPLAAFERASGAAAQAPLPARFH